MIDMFKYFNRKVIQFLSLILTNPHFTNLINGKLYKGSWKQVCSPGLNCYSCPAANFACPIGSLQTVFASPLKFSFYVSGFLLMIGLFIGRAVCAFLCPFGLFQELLHKIPFSKFKLWRPLTKVKYFILVIFVFVLPMTLKLGEPTFCEYICPAGTLEAAIPMLITHSEYRSVAGALFMWKFLILIITIIGCMSIYRFFCKLLCPLGAIYGLLNKISLYRFKIEADNCINCGKCQKSCKMDLNPVTEINSAECILCGECKKVCPKKIIH